MKPVFVSDSLGCLYQSGYRHLVGMHPAQRQSLANDVSLALAVSRRVTEGFPTVHLPFGDNRKWTGPGGELDKVIWMAAGRLEEGENVLVYCYGGRNRSGLVCALIIRALLGVTGAEALHLVRRARKGAVGGNEVFASYLEGLPAP